MKQRQICLRLVCLCHRLVDVAAPAGIWPIPRGRSIHRGSLQLWHFRNAERLFPDSALRAAEPPRFGGD
jgi:hypothetical protein